MDEYHTDIRLQLLAQGHAILPNRGKLPGLPGWNAPDYAAKQLTSTGKGSAAERVARWGNRFPDAVSTGMRIEEGRGVVDVDVDDGGLVAGLWAWLETNLPEVASARPGAIRGRHAQGRAVRAGRGRALRARRLAALWRAYGRDLRRKAFALGQLRAPVRGLWGALV